jgi:microcompartment protein CcmK/EutM
LILARVAGTVVATRRSDGVAGARFLLVELCSDGGVPRGEHLVAIDDVGAGPGELVMVSQGPSARQTTRTHQKAVDALVSGIVDEVEVGGRITYDKRAPDSRVPRKGP